MSWWVNFEFGTGGDDDIDGSSGEDIVFAFGGDDTIHTYDGDDLVFAGSGDDTVYAGAGDDTVFAGSGDDTVYGESGDDFLVGQSGGDLLDGGAGHDFILGGTGTDTLLGGSGNDKLLGGRGADILDGGTGDDRLYGQQGMDIITGGAGNDIVKAGSGNDTVYYKIADNVGDSDFYNGGSGSDVLVLDYRGTGISFTAVEASLISNFFDLENTDKFVDFNNIGANLAVALKVDIDLVAKKFESVEVIPDVIVSVSPEITTPAAVAIDENTTFVIDIDSTDDDDAEGSGLTYAVTGGADAALFSVNSTTGVLSFISAPDFENPADANGDNDYDVQVTVTDSGGLTDTQNLVVSVTDVNENPTIISAAAASVAENTNFVIDVNSTDPEGDAEGAGLTYAVTGGADAALFVVNSSTGVLNFISAPDFENPADANGDNDYDIQVTVTDSGGLTDTQNLVVSVTNVNENPTIISAAAASVAENTNFVIDVNSTDPEGDAEGAGLTYAIAGGADAALFSVNSTTGVLNFISAPDFENPQDVDGDNIYDVAVSVTDPDGLTDTQSIVVSVTDIPNLFTASADSVNFNSLNPADYEGNFFDALGGNDVVVLPNAVNAAAWGYVPGVTVFYGGAGNDTITGGDADDIIEGGAGADVLNGGAGVDTVSYENSSAGVLLHFDFGSYFFGDADGDSLSNFEQVVGSAFKDDILGSPDISLISGGAGDDELYLGTVSGALNGDEGDDYLSGYVGNDTLNGGAGDDILIGGGGADVLDGDAGIDVADYTPSGSAVTVNLDTGTGLGGNAQGDTLANIENVIGSNFNDTLTGDANDNVLNGGVNTNNGNDTLNGLGGDDTLLGGSGDDIINGGDGDDIIEGGAGADILDGGLGINTLSYANSSAGVLIDSLSGVGQATGGDADGDSVVFESFNNVIGSDFNDQLYGSSDDNVIDGGAGNDIIEGFAGNDVLTGGTGDDVIGVGLNSRMIFNKGDGVDVIAGPFNGGGSGPLQQIDLSDYGVTYAQVQSVTVLGPGSAIINVGSLPGGTAGDSITISNLFSPLTADDFIV